MLCLMRKILFLRPHGVRNASSKLKKTPLFDLHVANGAKLVDFTGWAMPVQYAGMGIAESHRHTRTNCGLFDVSHMVQSRIHGKDKIRFLESLTVANVHGLSLNQGILTLFTNTRGGIIDDLIVTRCDQDFLYVVTNAGCAHKDIAHMQERQRVMTGDSYDVTLEVLEDQALVALQGPDSFKVLQPLLKNIDLSKLSFMSSAVGTLAGVESCRITRCGYTGEDGFELSVPSAQVVSVCEQLLKSHESKVHLAGLGARDSLRLEAGLCLYGNDINEETTPVEAALAWTIAKRRRALKNFPGADVIMKQLTTDKPSRKRVGLISEGPPARAQTEVLGKDSGLRVGKVTSGCPSPTMGMNVAMAYLDSKSAKIGTKVDLVVRNKKVEAEVVKMPFVKTKYFVAT